MKTMSEYFDHKAEETMGEVVRRMPEDVQYVYDRLNEVVNTKDEYDENEPVIVVFR